MTGGVDPLEALAGAVHRAHDPAEQFAEAVAAVFAEAAERDGGAARRHLALADTLAEWREIRDRQEAKYGDPAEMMARMEARGAGRLSARLWC
jgi:hypothetical protein